MITPAHLKGAGDDCLLYCRVQDIPRYSAGIVLGLCGISVFTLKTRACERICFICPPEEILHHCIHSKRAFGVAGRFTAHIVSHVAEQWKGVTVNFIIGEISSLFYDKNVVDILPIKEYNILLEDGYEVRFR